MDREQEQALSRRALRQYAGGAANLAAAGSVSPVTRYTDPDRFARELERIHRRMPVPCVHSSELPGANAFLRRDTSLGNVLFTRDEQGVAHAFHNVCRHRGAELVAAESGCSRRLVCPYHAWSYGTDGKLLSVPAQQDCFPGLAFEERGLAALPCTEVHGMIWLCPGAGDEVDARAAVADHLGAMAADLDWLALDRLQVFRRHSRDWLANWKLVSEGGLETYHFKSAHRATIGPYFPHDVSVQDRLGIHSRVIMPSEKAGTIGDESEGQLRMRDFTHTLFGVAPQSSFLAQERHVDWIRMRPLAVDRTEIVITSLVPVAEGGMSGEEERHWDTNMRITVATLDEDFLIGEGIQRGLASGANGELLFGRSESLLTSFNEWVERYLADPQALNRTG